MLSGKITERRRGCLSDLLTAGSSSPASSEAGEDMRSAPADQQALSVRSEARGWRLARITGHDISVRHHPRYVIL